MHPDNRWLHIPKVQSGKIKVNEHHTHEYQEKEWNVKSPSWVEWIISPDVPVLLRMQHFLLMDQVTADMPRSQVLVMVQRQVIEMLKKGRLDFSGLSAENYVKKTSGKPWGTKVKKIKEKNLGPKSYGFIAWNFKNELFKSRKVRVALSKLFNRRLMNKKFRYSMSLLATGPWYRQSPYASKKVKPIEFDPKQAAALLKAEGWADTDKNGILDKVINGKKTEFKFSLMNTAKDAEKYFTAFPTLLEIHPFDESITRNAHGAYLYRAFGLC